MAEHQLTTAQQIALAEYKELCAYHRHEDTTKWTVIALTFGGALAAVSWGLSNGVWTAWIGLAVGAALVEIGGRVFAQIHSATSIRLERAQELEQQLGMNSHRLIAERDTSQRDPSKPRQYLGGLAPNMADWSRFIAIFFVVAAVFALLAIPVLAMLPSTRHCW